MLNCLKSYVWSFAFFKVLIVSFLIIPNVSRAQEFIVENFSKNEGLIHSAVSNISQNNDGFIILLGDKGYSYFNGESFTNYASIIENQKIEIAKLLETDNHTYYFLSKKGNLFIQKDDLLQKLQLPDAYNNWVFTSLEVLDDQSILFGSLQNGLIRMFHNSIRVYDSIDGLYSDHILNIYSDNDQTYIVTSNGINLFSDDKVLPLLKNDTLTHTLLYKDTLGIYWSCVADKGIYRIHIDKENEILTNESCWILFDKKLPNSWLNYTNEDCINFGVGTTFESIDVDNFATIWIATNHGIYRIIENAYGEIYVFPESPKYTIASMILDDNSNIWYTAKGVGLFKISRNSFNNYQYDDRFPSMSTRMLLRDNYDNFWIADDNYWLGYYSCATGFKAVSKPNFIGKEQVLSTALYSVDEILLSVGTKLLLLKGPDFNISEFPIQLSKQFINTVYVDTKQNLWLGCKDEGLWKLGNEKFDKLNYSKQHLSVFDIYEDRLQKIWLSTNDGLYYIKNDSLLKADFQFNRTEIDINAFSEDYLGQLWIASSKGAYILKNNTVIDSINSSNGLTSDNITTLSPYNQFMIIGTPEGLVINSNNKFKYLTTSDGICSNAINGRKMLANSAELFLSTNAGLSIFLLNDYFEKNQTIDVYLSEYKTNIDTVKILNRELKDEYFIDFEKGVEFISFSFDLLNLDDVLCDLNYKMVCDNDTTNWKSLSKNEVFINKPEVGNCKLILRANVVGHKEYSQIVINYANKKLFYKTLLFKILFILTVLSFIIFFLRKYQYPPKKNGEKYKTSSLSKIDCMRIKERLDSLLFTKQYYRNPEISLHLLSNELKVSKEHISQVINTQFESNFNTLINSLRVKEACELLKKNKGKSSNILQIGYYVGFNSKSSFNSAFKKQTGFSPTVYQNKFSENAS